MDEADKNADDDRGVALDARDWIVRLTSGNVSDAELTRFKAWRERSPQHRLAFERERAFWKSHGATSCRSGRRAGQPSAAALCWPAAGQRRRQASPSWRFRAWSFGGTPISPPASATGPR
jgi:transmembrane sensor